MIPVNSAHAKFSLNKLERTLLLLRVEGLTNMLLRNGGEHSEYKNNYFGCNNLHHRNYEIL